MERVLFEEKQRPDIHLWHVMATLVVIALLIVARGEFWYTWITVWFFMVSDLLQRLTVRVTTDKVQVIRGRFGDGHRIALDQIVRCAAVEYKFSGYPTVPIANQFSSLNCPGLESPFAAICLEDGTRGVRLDLTDGSRFLISTNQPERVVELIRELKSAPTAA
ncbi:MAG TPA: hypothetical protein VKE70_30030 [Candidatus Solibacter sp.]|nr:hypothetical protein [Candidatus Solibacter sp.]